MVFSSATFLFLFLPLVLLAHALSRSIDGRNNLLLAASLIFYGWGETHYVLILLFSVLINGWCAKRIASAEPAPARAALIAGVSLNLLLLGVFKYADFVVENLGYALSEGFRLPGIHLPLGISFFTFQAISYLVDVYRREAEVQKSYRNVALYICLFPQLIAGPIVRYAWIHRMLSERTAGIADTAWGIRRFIVGLAKKVLIANVLGETADDIFAGTPDNLSASAAWLGLICYTLQIYFDFSGYSDMAIGLGRMFGFRFPENFNYPYLSMDIQEFWRRWHISLSSWFRDYLYIPLGGNRHGAARTYLNLIVVFSLCGLWHGASWSFLIWGLWHGLFLVLERLLASLTAIRLPALLRWTYMIMVVMTGWVFFRSDNAGLAMDYLVSLWPLPAAPGERLDGAFFVSNKLLTALLAGVFLALPFSGWQRSLQTWFYRETDGGGAALGLMGDLWLLALLLSSSMMIAAGTYNPFIYFRF